MTVIYNDTDYVKVVKQQVKGLIEAEFAGAAVYNYDPDNLPQFGDAGTFCIEGLASGANTGYPIGQVYVTLRIWTYYDELDGELGRVYSPTWPVPTSFRRPILLGRKAVPCGENTYAPPAPIGGYASPRPDNFFVSIISMQQLRYNA
jgi:hypothetical protein